MLIKKILLISLVLVIPNLVFGAGGIQDVTKASDAIVDMLKGAAYSFATISALWGGYQVLFQSQPFMRMAPFFLGAVILAGAPSVVGIFFD